jgi:hypothetical protein
MSFAIKLMKEYGRKPVERLFKVTVTREHMAVAWGGRRIDNWADDRGIQYDKELFLTKGSNVIKVTVFYFDNRIHALQFALVWS